MSKLEDLQPNTTVRGILPDCLVTVVNVQWFGSTAVELTYKTSSGKLANELLYRHDEPRIEIIEQGRPWNFDGDGALFRLVSEANRIRLAHLFDPVLAVHTSVVEPLPHQITAVYEAMLPRQPLRFLLADDPGAGKTIMAGLLIKELIARGDIRRCLVVCPGNLAEQWQDELFRRFHLPFEILTNDKFEAARTGNWFLEANLVIARLDKLSRNEDVQEKLKATDCRWDLIICDEAHKMSATYFGGEVKYTKRYRLGQLLSTLTRHFLLMTATPHNGKEEDFQLFMALLDGDRFEGRFRDGAHVADVSDLMRRMVKENLLKFDGTPLFPERIAYTVAYKLSPAEAQLYKAVTEYVREEFNRAEALQNDKRAGTVGFALTILQRRLASSPEAIYQSIRRRRERLESRLRELELLQRGGDIAPAIAATVPMLDADDVEDLDEAPDNEVEAAEEEILDQATAARTIAELKAEIRTLQMLEGLALAVRRSGSDTKWKELAALLSERFSSTPTAVLPATVPITSEHNEIPRPVASPSQKLVIFTEHRDTLNYLESRITTLLGRKDAVVVIHGSLGREERMKAQESFKHDPEVQVLLATDAAGEGINLQRAHLMVNYDLPWNPNRIEQRFGRIHRIGQTEVCHLWNLLADETREGDVYRTLLEKLEEARKALGGQVFDVLGKMQFDGKPLRDLLIEAIRHGERPDVRANLTQIVSHAFDRSQLEDLLEERALVHDAMDASRVRHIREDTSPVDVLRELMNQYAPCLILIDEWVSYARQLHDQGDLPAGNFETHFTFAQALTESARMAKQCLLVISLPASDTTGSPHAVADDVEVGGERGRAALDRLRNAVGRVEASWRPASAEEEGFEIVRRRLFEPLIQQSQFVARDTVAREFYDLYRTQHQEFPPECRDSEYEKRLRAAYPIHPEIFDRLYNDWSTLVKFQRTRGVLRLMAAVIHSLWEKGDRNPLILPANIAIDDPRVQFELTRYLSDNWVPVIEKDVDGPNSLPLRVDGEVPNLGKYSACRRVARTVYLGSAPTATAANRGIEDRRIKLGCVLPGESPAVFGDALRRLATVP